MLLGGKDLYLNREYDIAFFSRNYTVSEYTILTSGALGFRQRRLLELFGHAHFIDMQYSVTMDTHGVMRDSFTVKTSIDSQFRYEPYTSLYQDLYEFVTSLNNHNRKIIIDISGFHIRLLGALLSMISDHDWDSLICAYTESTDYPLSDSGKGISSLSHGVLDGATGKFDLHRGFWGYNEIPNLKTTTTERDHFVWIVFLGFEGNRSIGIYNELKGEASYISPVITMPAIKPGWANYAYEANQDLFNSAEKTCTDIDYIAALDPFATFNYLEAQKIKHPKRHLVISPLGTRPTSLGVLLYAMLNEECEIFFDTPKESESKIVQCGNTYLYDVLSFFEK